MFKERDVNAAYTCLVILNLARYHKVVMLSEVTVNTKWGANAWNKRGHSIPGSSEGPGTWPHRLDRTPKESSIRWGGTQRK